MRILLISVTICWGLASISLAQSSYTEHTLKLNSEAHRPKANIESLNWLSGHWKGNGFNGISEEVWSPPSAGSMMGVYRSINDGEVQFYEIVTIVEEEDTLVLRLKHFDKNLKGWEEKDETVDFPLIKMENDAAYFEGFTIKREDSNKMTIYLVVKSTDEIDKEVRITYQKLIR